MAVLIVVLIFILSRDINLASCTLFVFQKKPTTGGISIGQIGIISSKDTSSFNNKSSFFSV